MWLSARHREANGIGYPKGYTSLDFLYTHGWGCNFYTFLDLRGHLDNDKKWATNAGLGFRWLTDCCPVIYGLNFFWDWREARHFNYHQLGAGLEFLWPCWDLRVNGYVPLSLKKKTYQNSFDKFKGNQAIFERKQEVSMWGADAAVGYWLYNSGCFGIHTALGGYYFRGKSSKDLYGGLFRAKVRLTDYITLEGQASWDTEFRWLGQGELALNLPFGPKVRRASRMVTNCCDLLAMEYRLVEKVQRFEIPVTSTKKSKDVARDPVTGLPLTFYFVDNNSNSAGTFESPFPTLALAEAAAAEGDVIYVFPGDGTDTGMDAGITLKNRQSLVGSGGPFAVSTRFGTIEIPTQTGVRPKVSNVDSAKTVTFESTIAQQILISGLSLSSSDASTISKPSGEMQDLTVQYCTINTRSPAMPLESCSSLVSFLAGISIGSFSSGDLICSNTSFATDTSGPIRGINMGSFAGRDFTVENSSISMLDDIGILIDTFSGRDFLCNSSSISNTGDDAPAIGIVTFTGRDFTAKSSSITTSGNETTISPSGILFAAEFSGNNFTFENSSISTTGDGASGIEFATFTGNDFTAEGSSIFTSGSTAPGIYFPMGFTGNDFTFDNSSITTVSGVSLTLDRPFTGQDLLFKDSTFSSVGSDAINFQAISGRDFILENCTISSTGRSDLFVSSFAGRDFLLKNSSLFAGNGSALVLVDFTGRDFLCADSNLASLIVPISIPTFSGDSFTCRHSSLLATAGKSGSEAAIFLGEFSGEEISLTYNTITCQVIQGVLINQIPSSPATNMRVQNNKITAADQAIFFATEAPFTLVAQNNLFTRTEAITDNAVVAAKISAETTHLRFWKNTSVAPAGIYAPNFFGINAPTFLEAESPNLQQSGLEALNDGGFEFQGAPPIFVPFE